MRRLLLTLLFICTFWGSHLQAQQPIGGPYESDSATVLLMHFDDTVRNAATRYQIGKPRSIGSFYFDDFGYTKPLQKQLRINNSQPNFKSRIQIPDTAALDLTGSWTIELWASFFAPFLEHTHKPRLMVKPLDSDSNSYTVNLPASYFIKFKDHEFGWVAGYHDQTKQKSRIELKKPNNSAVAGEWFHITYIRDTLRDQQVLLLHQNAQDPGLLPDSDDELKLVYSENQKLPEADSLLKPAISENPLYIGGVPQSDTTVGWFDGYIDELRISNTVRHEQIWTSSNRKMSEKPASISLKQNYPNPFNNSTVIGFKLPKTSKVHLAVYNSLGVKVSTLIDKTLSAGWHTVTFDASGLASGLYIYALHADGVKKSRTMLLVK